MISVLGLLVVSSLLDSTDVNVFPLVDVAVASPCSTTPHDFEHLFLSDDLCAL